MPSGYPAVARAGCPERLARRLRPLDVVTRQILLATAIAFLGALRRSAEALGAGPGSKALEKEHRDVVSAARK